MWIHHFPASGPPEANVLNSPEQFLAFLLSTAPEQRSVTRSAAGGLFTVAFQPPANWANILLLSHTPDQSDCVLRMTHHRTRSCTESERIFALSWISLSLNVLSLGACKWWLLSDGDFHSLHEFSQGLFYAVEVDYTGITMVGVVCTIQHLRVYFYSIVFFIVLRIGSFLMVYV